MSQHTHALANAPAAFKLANGTTYMASAFTENDLLELDDWIRGLYMANAKRLIKQMPAEDHDKYERLSFGEALRLSFREPKGYALLAETSEGAARIAYQLVKKHTQETFTQFKANFMPNNQAVLENINELNRLLDFLTPKPPAVVEEEALERVGIDKKKSEETETTPEN